MIVTNLKVMWLGYAATIHQSSIRKEQYVTVPAISSHAAFTLSNVWETSTLKATQDQILKL